MFNGYNSISRDVLSSLDLLISNVNDMGIHGKKIHLIS